MIKTEEVFYAGKITKPHGLNGEVVMRSEVTNIFEEVDCSYVVCDIDGILVPFFLESYEFQNDDTLFLKIERIESAEATRPLLNREVYLPNCYMEKLSNEALSWNYFKGFKAIDAQAGALGEVVDVDTSTVNTLFLIKQGKKEYLVPAVEDFIASINRSTREIHFCLPEGLIDI